MKRYLLTLLIPLLAFTFPFHPKDQADNKRCLDCHSDILESKHAHQPVSQSCESCHTSTGQAHPKSGVKGFTLAGEMPGLCYSCHTPLNTREHVHAVVKNGKCMLCHEPHSSDHPSLLKVSNVANSCVECHDDLELEDAKSLHKPIASGRCQDCHNPHQSDTPKLLKSKAQELCLNCHTEAEESFSQKSVHPPYRNSCSSCHSPHASQEAHLLKGKGNDLCLECHTEAADQMELAYTHSPFKNKCSICHTAHTSDVPGLLTKKPLELCTGCHDEFEEPLQNSALIHQPMKDAKSCMNCHSAHASETEKILISEQTSLCLSCHNVVMKKGDRTLLNMKQLLQKNKFVHSAIAKNGCSSCHNPHYADLPNLLTARFPATFYTPGIKDSLALCFACHDEGLLKSPVTTTATSFRNGDKNLHFVHVNGAKGRNCTVCHDAHAGMNKFLLNETIPFGNWTMKMRFTEKEKGGSCQTACHAVMSYQR